MSIRKQTKIWTCKNGDKLRICDMTDAHLENAIKMIERNTAILEKNLTLAGNPFSGDIAGCDFDLCQVQILEEGLDPEEASPIYASLVDEQNRRKLSCSQKKT